MTKRIASLIKLLTMGLFSLALLGGCATTGGGISCPPMGKYSAETRAQMKAELRTLPNPSAVKEAMKDYHRTRDACRAADV